MIGIRQRGDFHNAERFLEKNKKMTYLMSVMDKYGQRGVDALASATPKKTGRTANSWYYRTSQSNGVYKIEWMNDNVNEGIPIAVLIQYGHGLHQGGYVQGVDYINPAMADVFVQIAEDAWSEVTSA